MIVRQRTKYLLIAGVIGALIMLLVSIVTFYFIYTSMIDKKQQQALTYQEKYNELVRQMDEQKHQVRQVYVLKQDVEAGTQIEASMLQRIEVPADVIPDNLVDSREVIGKYTKLDLAKNTLLTEAMVFRDGILPHDLRHVEYSFIDLPSRLQEGHFVDIRIKFPTGHDYIVLSKKKIIELFDQTVRYEIGEKEILTMSSAIVDAYLHNATLYAVTYVDPYTQDAAVVTYPVKAEVLELIENNPNIVSLSSAALEARNRPKLESDLAQMDEATKMNFTDEPFQSQHRTETKRHEEQNNIQRTEPQQEEQSFADLVGSGDPITNMSNEQRQIFESNTNVIPISP